MQNAKEQPHAETGTSTGRQLPYIALAAAAIIALVFSPAGDQGFMAIVFLGPILTGIAARLLDLPWKLAAAPWALSGIFFFAYDGLVNSEDMGFHAVLTVMMVAFVALGALIGRPVRGRLSRSVAAGA